MFCSMEIAVKRVELLPIDQEQKIVGLDVAALIMELDGFILDVAKLYYKAWKQVAEEYQLPFDPAWRDTMPRLSYREVLETLLAGRSLETGQAEEMVERKNQLYREMVDQLAPADILPGVVELLQEAREQGIGVVVTAAGRDARRILDRLGLNEQIDALVEGSSVPHARPAPDLLLRAAHTVGAELERCVVLDATAAGIAAARAARMWTVGLGQREAGGIGAADLVYHTLSGVSLSEILDRLAAGGSWRIREPSFDPARRHAQEAALATGNGYLATRGSFEEGFSGAHPATLIGNVDGDGSTSEAEPVGVLDWLDLRLALNGEAFSLQEGTVLRWERSLDMRDGALTRRVLWRSPAGKTVQLSFLRCPSMAEPHRLALRCRVRSIDFRGRVEVAAGLNGQVKLPDVQHWTELGAGYSENGIFMHRRSKPLGIELAAAAALQIDLPARAVQEYRLEEGRPTLVAHFSLEVGEEACVDKLVTLWTSRDTGDPLGAALADLASAVENGYAGLRRANARRWLEIWRDSDIAVKGDDVADRAARFDFFSRSTNPPF